MRLSDSYRLRQVFEDGALFEHARHPTQRKRRWNDFPAFIAMIERGVYRAGAGVRNHRRVVVVW